MADVFVSYKREDRDAVGRIVTALREENFDLWWDQEIPPDAPWEATIEREIGKAKLVIVAWSPLAIRSDSVKAEARTGRTAGRLLQVFVEPCEPPLFFGERQGVDLSAWNGDRNDVRFKAMLAAARLILSGQRPSDAIAYAPKQVTPPAWALTAAGVALLASFISMPRATEPTKAPVQPGPAPPPVVAHADPRADLLKRVAGSWGKPGCAVTVTYYIERRTDGDFVVVTDKDFRSEARVLSAEGSSVFTRTTAPKDQIGQQWELQMQPDQMNVVDKNGTATPLVRCGAPT